MNLLVSVKHCPACGTDFDSRFYDSVPTIDRFSPALGYEVANSVLLCRRCNRIKLDATSTELRRIADWMDRTRTLLDLGP